MSGAMDSPGQPRSEIAPARATVTPASRAGGDVARLASDMHAVISTRWPAYYPNHEQHGAPTVTLSTRHCGFSVLFKADLQFGAAAHERLIVKIRREHKYGSAMPADVSSRIRELTRLEYAEHVRAYGFFAARRDGLSVVRPFDYVESHNALVVEHAAGRDLSILVSTEDPIGPTAIERCGRWWRAFHVDLHQARPRPWAADALDAALERRLHRLTTIGAPPETLARLQETIRDVARRVPPTPVPVSLIHGDCKLRHVWATEDGIQVLDFGNTKTGDSWIDPAALVVELCLYSLWSRRLDSGGKADDIRTLLRAYFDGPPPLAFSLYVVDCLLKKWHRRLRRWGPGRGMSGLQRSLQRAGLAHRVDRLYVDRWFTSQIQAWLGVATGAVPSWLEGVAE